MKELLIGFPILLVGCAIAASVVMGLMWFGHHYPTLFGYVFLTMLLSPFAWVIGALITMRKPPI